MPPCRPPTAHHPTHGGRGCSQGERTTPAQPTHHPRTTPTRPPHNPPTTRAQPPRHIPPRARPQCVGVCGCVWVCGACVVFPLRPPRAARGSAHLLGGHRDRGAGGVCGGCVACVGVWGCGGCGGVVWGVWGV